MNGFDKQKKMNSEHRDYHKKIVLDSFCDPFVRIVQEDQEFSDNSQPGPSRWSIERKTFYAILIFALLALILVLRL